MTSSRSQNAAVLNINMAACSIFEEDEVSVITNKGYKCGLVVESSEYVSSDEEEDSYSPEFVYQRVRKGLVRVAWHPDGQEDVVQEKSVRTRRHALLSIHLKKSRCHVNLS